MLWVTKRLDSRFVMGFHGTMLRFLFGDELDSGENVGEWLSYQVVDMIYESGVIAIRDEELDR